MKRVAVLLSIEAMLVGGCSFLERRSDSTDGPGSSRPLVSGGPTFSATPLSPDGPTVLTGTLGFGAVEGGCGFLETADGKLYEVIYPDGWRLDRATGHLIGPDGQDVGPGAVVSVRGSIATDMASICQVGPMYRAVEVLSAGT